MPLVEQILPSPGQQAVPLAFALIEIDPFDDISGKDGQWTVTL